jgi:hypothetical protein
MFHALVAANCGTTARTRTLLSVSPARCCQLWHNCPHSNIAFSFTRSLLSTVAQQPALEAALLRMSGNKRQILEDPRKSRSLLSPLWQVFFLQHSTVIQKLLAIEIHDHLHKSVRF